MRSRRLLAAATAAAIATVLAAAPASAHVSVNPGEAPKGGFTKLSFRVPNERAVPTIKVEVAFPPEHPIAFVSTKPIPGWTVSVDHMTLAKPIVNDDGDNVTEAVSRITWSGGSIAPGEFQEFDVSVGPLPDDADQLEFKALQTYEGGEVVRWIDDPPAKGEDEPENPAPILTLTGPKAGAATTVPSGRSQPQPDEDEGVARAAVVMAALAIGIAAVALVTARRSHPTEGART